MGPDAVPLVHLDLGHDHALGSDAGHDAVGPGGRVIACVSTRHGGVSAPPYDTCNLGYATGDDPAAVRRNRAALCRTIGFSLDDLVVANQVHGAEVVVVDAAHRGRGAHDAAGAVADADALVTATPGVLLGVLIADCVPVVLWDPRRAVVAVAHAGWRGTVAHVVARTVRAMGEHFGCDPAVLRAGIGPSIGPASYEVGDDVVTAAHAAFPDAAGLVHHDGARRTFDLWAANTHELVAAGVRAEHITCSHIDTFTSTDRFFSHRAGAPTGRFMAFAAIGAGTPLPG